MLESLALLARRARRRVVALFGGETLDQEHDAEVMFHLESETEDLIHTYGLSSQEARRRALAAFGGVTQTREAQREARGIARIESLGHDIRYSFRTLRRAPTFSLSAVLVLALGIGASTGIFTAVDAVLLSRLPFPHPDRLVYIGLRHAPGPMIGLSTVDAQAIARGDPSLAAFGVADRRLAVVTVDQEPQQLPVAFADAGFFRALGVRAAHGRLTLAADDVPGAPPVAVLGHAFAVHAYGAPAHAVGQTLMIDGAPYIVIGVLPREIDERAGVHPVVWPARQDSTPTRRGPFGLFAVARLADGASLAIAQRELTNISRRVFPEWAASYQDSTATYAAQPLRTALLGGAPDSLAVLSAAVALVLLIVVANVANLMFVRAIARWPEFALRQTLGASRPRLVRLVVTEAIVLALVGAILGVGLSVGILRALLLMAPEMPRLAAAHIDPTGASFAVALAGVCGAALGILTAFVLLRGTVTRPMDAPSRTASQGRGPLVLRSAFVAGQFALALPLLTGAGLLLASFLRLQQVDPGFNSTHVLTVRLSLPSRRYAADTSMQRFWTEAMNRLREVPGVEAVGFNSNMPPADPNVCCNNFNLIDHPVPNGAAQPASPWLVASADYFTALGVPRIEGRAFGSSDTGSSPPVIAVSESWARHYFPEGNVIGRRLVQGGCTTCPLTTVIAVVGDVKYMGLGASADAVYSPLGQMWGFANSGVLFIRTTGLPRDALPAVRVALRSIDPMLPLGDIAPLTVRMADALTTPRRFTSLLGAFALVALLLASVGIFGMLSYTVATRRRELGIRLALGAAPRSLVRTVVAGGMACAGTGALAGLVITLLTIRRFTAGARTFVEVQPADPRAIGVVIAVLLGAALLASLLPAMRAAGTDPLTAIRAE